MFKDLKHLSSSARSCRRLLIVLLSFSASASASDMDKVKTLLDQGKLPEAIELLVRETDENPAHEAARVMLAETYEKAVMPDKAVNAWRDLATLSRNDENLRKARRGLSRLRRQELDKQDVAETGKTDASKDPFKIPMPEIEWDGLQVIEDNKYLPPILPPPLNLEVPPLIHETKHFTVYSTNERLSKTIGERAEIYLDFMIKKLFGSRSWAVRFPILVYTTEADYQQHGAPAGSHGVTIGHITGKIQAIVLFQLRPEGSRGSRSGSRGGGSGGQQIYKYAVESILPHELTHAVINEFFGAQETPRWLHEAVAGRFEQTRDHYGEAARLARKVVAGEYFRMRDLFEQKVYPERIGLFYEQSAVVVLYLFEAGPDAMYAFLSELAAGNSHDAACAASLGIPEKNAVEEFEKRWVDWMRRRYVKDLDITVDDTQTASADKSTNAAFLPWVNELDTAESISSWRDIDLTSLKAFNPLGRSKEEWSAKDGILRCDPPRRTADQGPSLLGLRMNETAPMAITAEVRYLGSPGDSGRQFGFTQLDADGYDTRVEALATLRDNLSHKVVCVWSDDLALYIDGVNTARYPAFQTGGNAQDVDFPLALVAFGPVEVQNLRVASIKSFSEKPVVAQADTKQDDPSPRRSAREDRRPRRDEKEKKEP
ncbi:MAG: hypothetical protein AAB363_11400 [Planctomycetota bacterium]